MKILKNLYNILMPRRCIVCKGTLEPNEEYLCTSCSIQMPRYQIKSIEDNEVLRKAWNFAPIEYGATLLYYRHQSNYHNIIINAKYKGKTEMGAHMGQWAAIEIDSLKLAEKIDIIVPVPPDKERKKKRGYNQAEIIANGIGKAMQRPVRNFLIKKGSDEKKLAFFYKDTIFADMSALRAPADALEMMVDKKMWPLPTYGDMLFEV